MAVFDFLLDASLTAATRSIYQTVLFLFERSRHSASDPKITLSTQLDDQELMLVRRSIDAIRTREKVSLDELEQKQIQLYIHALSKLLDAKTSAEIKVDQEQGKRKLAALRKQYLLQE